MNVKRVLGFVAMLLIFAIPVQTALLDVGEMNNVTGLISFVAFLVLLFIGYALVDSSYPKPGANASGESH